MILRRNILRASLAAMGGLFALGGARRARAATPDKRKVVYHLSDFDKVSFVLGNIRNHLDGVGGPEHVAIALVVHGPALKAFRASTANPDLKKRVGDAREAGVEMNACAHTLKGAQMTLPDLLPGFISADGGGVVRLAELQAQGYIYIRP
jgi:intracellular sulfur oxidation DsrE/DsrF family protein